MEEIKRIILPNSFLKITSYTLLFIFLFKAQQMKSLCVLIIDRVKILLLVVCRTF